MDASNPKQQAVERLKSANNVLVTVSKNPSVDQLAALIGFTLLLNKLGKHATAVYSGLTPNTLEFLSPEETIEKTTDSLRDFIISLDKSKADKLRYKVEDDVVKIFITPYRTNLTDKDLVFSQGDFNVDAVVALGVDSREDLDQAIVSHGRILHDATVMTINAGSKSSDIGAINWSDDMASSLCEMLVSISESFQSGLLDAQMSTAFLTGIVAETERFSNPKTTPKVMTMSAQLMAAGANQQLIANKLNEHVEEPENNTWEPADPVKEESSEAKPAEPEKPAEPPKDEPGTLSIEHQGHEEEHEEAPAPQQPAPEEPKPEEPLAPALDFSLHDAPSSNPDEANNAIHIDEHGNMAHMDEKPAVSEEEQAISDGLKSNKRDLGTSMKVIEPLPPSQMDTPAMSMTPPTFGGALNSTVGPVPEPSTDPMSHNSSNPREMPAEEPPQDLPAPPTPDPIQQALDSLPKLDTPPAMPSMPPLPPTDPTAFIPTTPAPLPDPLPPPPVPEPAVADIPTPADIAAPIMPPQTPVNPLDNAVEETLSDLEQRIDAHHDDQVPVESVDAARDAVQNAISSMPYDPNHPDPVQALGAQSVDLNPAAPQPVPTAADPTAPPPVPPPFVP